MTRTFTNGQRTRTVTGLLAVGAAAWICVSLFGDHVLDQAHWKAAPADPAPAAQPEETSAPPPTGPSKSLRRAEARLRSWLSRRTAAAPENTHPK